MSVYGPGIWIHINMNNIADQIIEIWKITEMLSFLEQYLSIKSDVLMAVISY